MKLSQIALSVASVLLLNSCGMMMFIPVMPKENRLKSLYYTNVGTDPFSEGAQDGIVVGKVTLSGEGCILSIYGQGQNTPITQTMKFNKKKSYGLIFWKKEETRQTKDIFAGNLPKDRSESYKDVYSAGAVLKALFLGAGGTWRLNFAALHTQMSPGWFMLRLPPGRYQLRDIEYEHYDTNTQNSFGGTTTTTITSTNLSVAEGPSFEVAPGVINYIGEFDYNEKESTVKQDLAAAEEAVKQGLRRLPNKELKWKIVLAPNVTPSPASAPAAPTSTPSSAP